MTTFDHHPDPSTDFCIEVEMLEGWIEDLRAGTRSQWPFWTRLSRLIKFTKGAPPMDAIAERARPTVFTLEDRAHAAVRNVA